MVHQLVWKCGDDIEDVQYFTMPLWGSCVFKLISYAHALVGIMVHQLVWKCGDDIEDEQPQKEVLCERE